MVIPNREVRDIFTGQILLAILSVKACRSVASNEGAGDGYSDILKYGIAFHLKKCRVMLQEEE